VASSSKPPSADDTVEMDRLPNFDELETLVEDVRKASGSPDATLRLPALKLALPPPPAAAPAAAARKPLDETRLRPGVKLDALTRLRPSTSPEPPASDPSRSTARMRPPQDSLPRTIMDFGGEKGSVAPVAMPTFDAPSTPSASAWPPITQYPIPRRTWPLTAAVLVAVFASFVTLGAAIVAAWGDDQPGVAHAAASSLVLPPRAAPSSSSPLQPLTPATTPPRPPAPAPRPHPSSRSQVSDNPYEEGSAPSATPAPSAPPPAAPAPEPKDGADKKLEDLVRSLQRD
jgi:hypothetical protein